MIGQEGKNKNKRISAAAVDFSVIASMMLHLFYEFSLEVLSFYSHPSHISKTKYFQQPARQFRGNSHQNSL
jgi:hypothetical protein